MNPLRLRLEGFRSFAELELDLPAGCVAVNGANGAGKSTLVDAIDVALFGPEGRSFDPYLRAGADRMLVELELEHGDGVAYRVRRTYNGRRATLDVEQADRAGHREALGSDGYGVVWVPLTQGTVADTQAMLERELGLNRETFRSSALVRQGDGAAFTEAQPKDRKRILAAALGLDAWQAAEQRARLDMNALVREADVLDGTLRSLRDELEQAAGADDRLVDARAERDGHETELAALEQRLAAAREELDKAQADELRVAQVTAELAAARARYDELDLARERSQAAALRIAEHRGRVEALEAECETHRAALTRLEVSERAARAYELASAQRDALAREGDGLLERFRQNEARAEATSAAAATCFACGQPLVDEARKKALETIAAEQAELVAKRDRLREQHDAIDLPPAPDRVELDRVRAEAVAHADAPARLEAVRAVIAELEPQVDRDPDERERLCAAAAAEVVALEQRIAGLPEPTPGRVSDARNRIVDLEREVRVRRRRVGGAGRDVARLEAQAERAGEVRRRLEDLEAEHLGVQRRLDHLEVLVRAFGRDGVPAWIVEQHALPSIEAEANRILTVLSGPVERVELRTERELKSGAVADALDILCVTEQGERDYATFSGGERTRVNLALRIALARLLAQRRDADVRLLAIDEPDGLDEQGMSALVDVARGLVNRDEFDTILLASHVPALRDAFDRALIVERDQAGSRVTVA